jgi:general secretion pathway protein M
MMNKLLLRFKKLNRRERYIIYGAACVLAFILMMQFIVTPFFDKKKQMKESLESRRIMLAKMQQWQVEFKSLKKDAQISKSRFARRSKGFKLYSFMNQLAGQSGVRDRITYMKPSPGVQKNGGYRLSRVEMKLEAVTMEQLVKYLYGIETSENMVDVRKLAITKKDKKQGLVSVVMQVETIEI